MNHIKDGKNNYCKCIVVLLLFSFCLNICSYGLVNANPIGVVVWGERLELGGILPAEMNPNLSMTNADVLMEIDAINFRDNFIVSFTGNYTIANSGNTTEIQIGAPFSSPYFGALPSYGQIYGEMIEDLNNSLKITSNSLEVSFRLSYINATLAKYWHQYIPDTISTRLFAVCNITLNAFSDNLVQFSWTANIRRDPRSSFVHFYYDVGTSRGWEGNISEKVSFNITGRQPQFYTDYQEGYFEKQCQISNFKDGKLYSWEWLNERINESVVGVRYNTDKWTEYILYFFVFVPLVIITVVVFVIFIHRKRRLKM